MLGIYVHIPFCIRKCPYCDFYSVADLSAAESYTACILSKIEQYSAKSNKNADTLYFGGGTPSLMSAVNIAKIIDSASRAFNINDKSEITMEINPATANQQYFYDIKAAGVNRISLGMQSANDNELKLLGRLHTNAETINSVNMARAAGFDNLSLDLMLGTPEQTEHSLERSLMQCHDLSAEHISAYMLKVEPNTPYAKHLPGKIADDEQLADSYKLVCDILQKYGYAQYEISNWCRDGHISRHNMKYWQLENYLGLGPGAHSYIDGSRFYYDRDLTGFINGAQPINDGCGGDPDEYIMLALRLNRGIVFSEYESFYGEGLPKKRIDKMKLLEQNGFGKLNEDSFSLNADGMLLSNSAIGFILD